MPAVNVQVIEPGTRYQGDIVKEPILRYKNEKVVGTEAVEFMRGEGLPDIKIILDADAMSYVAVRYLYDSNGKPVMSRDGGTHKSYIMCSGFFNRGGGKYTVRTQGEAIFVPREEYEERKREKIRRAKLVNKRIKALQQFGTAIKEGSWGPTRFFDFGISFPDYSYLTWPTQAVESKSVKIPFGPRKSLADLWGGWNPNEVLEPEYAPPRYRERIERGITMLKKVSVEALKLLPEKEEKSPVIRLEGDGVKVYRTVDIPDLRMV